MFTVVELFNFYYWRIGLILAVIMVIWGCREKEVQKQETGVMPEVSQVEPDSITNKDKMKILITPLKELSDTTFIRLADYSNDFSYDLRYATTNNFLKAKVYDCAECYTRVKTAKALLAANKDFMAQGYRIKFFDCYRPNDVQYKMWELVPNPQYVANPVKGSIHNRGGAVDITLETIEGKELDMGTDFDFFGRRAYHDFTDLPQEILQHRKILKEIMEKYGFASIRSEWWHYNLRTASRDKVDNFRWPCPVEN